jgi:hypothetical protein
MLIGANDVGRFLFRMHQANENVFVPICAGEYGGHSIKTIGV